MPYGIHLLAGATLEVEPCAVVLVGAGRELVVQGDASLVAVGRADAPILFDGATPEHGAWIGLEVRAQALPDTRLEHVVVAHAGADPELTGHPPAAIRSAHGPGLDLRDVEVRDSGGWGVAMLAGGAFSPRARGLRVRGSRGDGAVYFADADAVRTLPDGDLRGNARDEITVACAVRTVRNEGTWRAREGVRYRVPRAARLLVEGLDAPRLTLAPGAVLAFDEDAEMAVGEGFPGSLDARADEGHGAPVLTSVATPPRAASWVGLVLGPRSDRARTALRGLTIEGAGAASSAIGPWCPVDAEGLDGPRAMLHFVGAATPQRDDAVRFVAGPSRGAAVYIERAAPVAAGASARPPLLADLREAGTRCAVAVGASGGQCPVTPRCPWGI